MMGLTESLLDRLPWFLQRRLKAAMNWPETYEDYLYAPGIIRIEYDVAWLVWRLVHRCLQCRRWMFWSYHWLCKHH